MMRREEGFTVIEVVVAATIMVLSLVATFATLDSSRRLTVVAEHQATLAQRAQAELERVQALPYSQVALTGTSPSWSTTPGSYTYVSVPSGACPSTPAGPAPTYQPDHSSGGSTATEPLVINGCSYASTVNGNSTTVTPTAGTVQPVTSWSATLTTGATASGSVYDFVTWTADPTCSQTSPPGSTCSTINDYKRVTVVVTQNGVTHPSNPAIVTGYVTQPSTGHNPCAAGSSGCGGTTCGSGPCTGSGCTTSSCTPIPTSPCTSVGCGTVPCAVVGCTGTTTAPPCTSMPAGAVEQSWVTQPIPVGSTWKLTGTGNTTLYLQSNNVAVSASICIGIYVVPGGVLTGATIPGNPYTYGPQTVSVPANIPTPVTLNFNSGIGPGGYLVSGVAGTEVEVVVWAAASANPVQLVNSPPTYPEQTTLDLSS